MTISQTIIVFRMITIYNHLLIFSLSLSAATHSYLLTPILMQSSYS